MVHSSKKIDISTDLNEKKDVEVKKSQRLTSLKKRQDKVEDEVAKFYNDKEFGYFQKPASLSRGLVWFAIIWSIVFGLIAGTVASLFVLTHESIDIPFYKRIDLTQFFPTRELNLTTEKNVTVTAETRITGLADDLKSKTFKFFKAKSQEKQSFLEQIYAPWQTKGLAVIISEHGWLMTGSGFKPETDYIALDQQNKIFQIEQIIQDPVTKISFLKVSGQGFLPAKLADISKTKPGQQVMLLDKFKNLHLTEISQAQTKNVYKTEDLVYSTDKFSDYLRLDSETSIGAFPNGLFFDLNGAITGLIVQEKIIPVWQVKSIIAQVLNDQEISRPYLGIDYLRIEQAPGLTGQLFKDLTQGAIVYGPPTDNSPALKAGIENADVIIKIDDIILDKDQDLTYLIQEKNPGDEIQLIVLRDGEEIKFQVVLGEKKE